MRVVVASKFWYERGGLERVMFEEIAGLEAAGCEVAHFSTSHPDNVRSPWQSYFAPYLELGRGSRLSATEKMLAAARLFANPKAARLFGKLLDDFHPDIVHVHGIHRQLSPSILFAARRRGIPVVQTLHDYHHVCPADVLLRGGDTRCEPRLCGSCNTIPCVRNRCVRGSLGASALSAAETSWQRARHAYERTVTRFVSPSRFLAAIMRDAGWKGVPIDIVPNAVLVPDGARAKDEGYFLIASRLSPEKGVDVALEAAAKAGVRVVCAGGGPLEGELRTRFPSVEFTGHLDPPGVSRLLSGSRAIVVPSLWFENAPMSVLEAMAHGVPVVASDLGGIPELVTDGAEGLLVPPGDERALISALRDLASDPEKASRLGARARERAREQFSRGVHMDRLLDVYRRALGRETAVVGMATEESA